MLNGKLALVTGVSRRAGIGHAIARGLAGVGADLFLHHHAAADRSWSPDPDGPAALAAELSAAHLGLDLTAPGAPEQLLAAAPAHVDILVCNHAHNGDDGPLGSLDAATLDTHWAVNTRSTLLLVQAFAAQHDGRAGGRVVLMTSGQGLGPMPNEIAYATSKAALSGITPTLADHLADRGITVNAVNPGPVDTGWPSQEQRAGLLPRFPAGRWGRPEDPAKLITWLVGPDAEWVTGQVINSEGGFRRH
ncbi:SDR family oxidoreductase [Actinokineospora diospyrosa]|uniref:3-oxoacyl-[acyl-carrier protein] reductase n=1 Tax=Actinokineospora diospyrosa TaxID=103728 RepID=A0ABT1I8B1_9PSEU|nr:SDR family oxidoreductase [Actinokineospora diospyrosa]MCP2268818.1 3-oxoacyl-[acyl-carrier protein] reductase [Actinokineospora diospyrosa]